jgi:hypothetical protein
MSRVRVSSVVVLVVLLSLTGCFGPKPVEVRGKVILAKTLTATLVGADQGQGKEEAGQDSLVLTFLKEGDDKPVSVSVHPKELTFESKAIVPGKYKVGFRIGLYAMPGPGTQKRLLEVQLFNKAHEVLSSKMTYEVTAESPQSITVDLTKEQVTRN